MELIQVELDNLFLAIEQAKDLAMLLEDYFYNEHGDKLFNRNASLCTTVVEKIKSIDSKTDEIYKLVTSEVTHE